jgi:drug/metabolite transporter (DMT)-like permease
MRRDAVMRATVAAHQRPSVPPALVLGVAILAMSWSGPLVRFTTAPALAVSAWRLTISTVFILLVLAFRRSAWQGVALTARELLLATLAGGLLAAHFWAWIASLSYTTVASSVVLVSMQPLFVAVLSVVWLRELPGRWQWAGIAVAVVGAAIIGWGDFAGGTRALYGDGLALAGAVFAAGYYVIGRSLRQRLDLWLYIGLVYGMAAVLLLGVVSLRADVALTGYARQDWLVFAALAAGPMMIGHTGVNYALRYVPAYLANLVTLGEPIGATLIAWLLVGINETPGPKFLLGGALVLCGIALGMARSGSKASLPAMESVSGG